MAVLSEGYGRWVATAGGNPSPPAVFGGRNEGVMGWSEWQDLVGRGVRRGIWECECCGEVVKEPIGEWLRRAVWLLWSFPGRRRI